MTPHNADKPVHCGGGDDFLKIGKENKIQFKLKFRNGQNAFSKRAKFQGQFFPSNSVGKMCPEVRDWYLY